MSETRHALTVDVEDYFQVQALARAIPRASWDGYARRVEANTERLLELFAGAGARATFFTLGWIAERHPALVRRIVAGGHELASHGYDHSRVDSQDPRAFRADAGRTRRLLEDIGGCRVIGYRAATFSMGPRTPWAHAVLAAEGHLYSSSIYPVRHDLYGVPDAPRLPFRPAGAAIWEFPMTTIPLLGRNVPCSGGGYFRLLPYPLFRALLRRFAASERAPGIFYLHPWEVDPAQPRVRAADRASRFRHYVNLARTAGRLERLLADFAWTRMDEAFAPLLAAPLFPKAEAA